eukprot:TRINITY_DN847_c0_g1_i16.p1 TRINITY_DN847_c0_g1~~TRINITY_DN847_c0_g1_i16.p1  ORF type:complete len:211 (-),score=6.12 TRINITY_DN847_c0_g1_i16:151-693(-)
MPQSLFGRNRQLQASRPQGCFFGEYTQVDQNKYQKKLQNGRFSIISRDSDNTWMIKKTNSGPNGIKIEGGFNKCVEKAGGPISFMARNKQWIKDDNIKISCASGPFVDTITVDDSEEKPKQIVGDNCWSGEDCNGCPGQSSGTDRIIYCCAFCTKDDSISFKYIAMGSTVTTICSCKKKN